MAADSVTTEFRRSLIEGALATLRDPQARKAAAMQTASIALNGGTGKIRGGTVEPSAGSVVRMIGALEEMLHDLEERVADAPPTADMRPDSRPPSNAKAKRGGERATGGSGDEQEKKPKAKDKPKSEEKPKGKPSDAEFEKLHPRGKDGVWIRKGEGTSGQPSPKVAQLQRRLVQLGYGPGAADGQMGPLTQAAVARFQEDYGLQQTGEVDPATAQIMANPPPQKVSEIQAEQERLQAIADAESGASETGETGASGATGEAGAVETENTESESPERPAGDSEQREQREEGEGRKQDRGSERETPEVPSGDEMAANGRSRSRSRTEKATAKGKGEDASLMAEGDSGPEVREAQKLLAALGYDLGKSGADGEFGAYTDRAVRKLQREHGLRADGKLGRRTMRLLKRLARREREREKERKVTEEQATTAHIESLQRKLVEAEEMVAVYERVGDTEGVIHSRAEAAVYRQRIEEAAVVLDEGVLGKWDPKLHPRNRVGEFQDVPTGSTVAWTEMFQARGAAPRERFGVVVGTRDRRLATRSVPQVEVAVPERKLLGKAGVGHRFVDVKDVTVVNQNRRRNVSEALADRFDEATVERLLAEQGGDALAFTRANATEKHLARRIVEEAGPDLDVTQARAVSMLGIRSLSARAVLDEAGCAMPHKAMSAKGMLKCPRCGDKIGKDSKTEVEEAIDYAAIEEIELTPDDHRAVIRFMQQSEWQIVEAAADRLDAMPPLVLGEAKLSAAQRKALPPSAFVFPKERRYPIHDEAHARNALARVAQNGTPEEKAKVIAAVARRYPNLAKRSKLREGHDLAEVKSAAYPSLERVPGKQNWVDKAGGLPSYIERIAKHLHYEKGMTISHAIAVAVNAVKKMCASGETNFPGANQVNAKSRAQACKAVAQWQKKKGGVG